MVLAVLLDEFLCDFIRSICQAVEEEQVLLRRVNFQGLHAEIEGPNKGWEFGRSSAVELLRDIVGDLAEAAL